ncbi:hypothetical protein D9M71_43220 [compost metagenome]
MSMRSLAWKTMVAATPRGTFSLPHCPACGHRFYPPQRHCPACLHGTIEFMPDDGMARVLSAVALHHSLDSQRFGHLPVYVLNVRTASGVSLFALADAPVAKSTEVVLELVTDADCPEGIVRARLLGE